MEWITKYELELANTFCKDWEPLRVKTKKLNIWEQDEKQLEKWKILDFIAVPIGWVTSSTVARNCRDRNLTDHWLVGIYVRLPEKKETWIYQSFLSLKDDCMNFVLFWKRWNHQNRWISTFVAETTNVP